MRALLTPIGAFADAHPYGVHVMATAVILASLAFVAGMTLLDRRPRP